MNDSLIRVAQQIITKTNNNPLTERRPTKLPSISEAAKNTVNVVERRQDGFSTVR
jgi:hypothetical protein